MKRTGVHPLKPPPTAALVLFVCSQAALAADRTVTIQATEFAFKPATIEVDPGETARLKLVNNGNLSHNLHLRGVGTKTGTIQAGNSDTIEFTATEAATVRFFCNVPGHEQAGMTGRMQVE